MISRRGWNNTKKLSGDFLIGVNPFPPHIHSLRLSSLSLSLLKNSGFIMKGKKNIPPWRIYNKVKNPSRDLNSTMTTNSIPPDTPIQMSNMMTWDLVELSIFKVWDFVTSLALSITQKEVLLTLQYIFSPQLVNQKWQHSAYSNWIIASNTSNAQNIYGNEA